MNWDAVAAISEMFGAIGVIATLVYLTTQIRQNTKSINSNNSNNVMNGFNAINVAMLANTDAARICYEGFYGIDNMAENDKHRFTHTMNAFYNIYRNLYHQYLDGTFEKELWHVWAQEARQMMMTPGVAYFRQRTKTYEDLFEYLETLPVAPNNPLSLK